mmetsp:Transcript_3978/g.10052  ORF Transcript_3978/g.10052 Transcript_3978/m.10052 type:complete len:237 (+) Transcript_3978:160-870(+)
MPGTAGQSPSTEARTSHGGAGSPLLPKSKRAHRTASSRRSASDLPALHCAALAPKKKMARMWRGRPPPSQLVGGDTSNASDASRMSGSAMAQCAPRHQHSANSTTTLITLPIRWAEISAPRAPLSFGLSERLAMAGGGMASTTRRAETLEMFAPSRVVSIAPSSAEWVKPTTSTPRRISTPRLVSEDARRCDSVPLPCTTRCVCASSRRTWTPPSSLTAVRKSSMETWLGSAQKTL